MNRPARSHPASNLYNPCTLFHSSSYSRSLLLKFKIFYTPKTRAPLFKSIFLQKKNFGFLQSTQKNVQIRIHLAVHPPRPPPNPARPQIPNQPCPLPRRSHKFRILIRHHPITITIPTPHPPPPTPLQLPNKICGLHCTSLSTHLLLPAMDRSSQIYPEEGRGRYAGLPCLLYKKKIGHLSGVDWDRGGLSCKKTGGGAGVGGDWGWGSAIGVLGFGGLEGLGGLAVCQDRPRAKKNAGVVRRRVSEERKNFHGNNTEPGSLWEMLFYSREL